MDDRLGKARWVALCTIPGVGGVTIRRLLERFGSLDAILKASAKELQTTHRVGEKTAQAIRRASPEWAARLLDSLAGEGIHALCWDDADYPMNLRTMPDAPPVLFVKGRLLPEDAIAVAIVGTRSPSPRALSAAEHIAGELAGRGITIVSGLAIGVDTAAHRGALAAGGRTLAVLGSGLRAIHPRSNAGLAARIAAQGALLSELHPDIGPAGTQLVARDRIISGLSRWVIVVESGVIGGSMRTAEFARRQGRILAALPGSAGADALLAAGAITLDWPALDWDALANHIKSTTLSPAPSQSSQLRLFDARSPYTSSIASPKL